MKDRELLAGPESPPARPVNVQALLGNCSDCPVFEKGFNHLPSSAFVDVGRRRASSVAIACSLSGLETVMIGTGVVDAVWTVHLLSQARSAHAPWRRQPTAGRSFGARFLTGEYLATRVFGIGEFVDWSVPQGHRITSSFLFFSKWWSTIATAAIPQALVTVTTPRPTSWACSSNLCTSTGTHEWTCTTLGTGSLSNRRPLN